MRSVNHIRDLFLIPIYIFNLFGFFLLVFVNNVYMYDALKWFKPELESLTYRWYYDLLNNQYWCAVIDSGWLLGPWCLEDLKFSITQIKTKSPSNAIDFWYLYIFNHSNWISFFKFWFADNLLYVIYSKRRDVQYS